ncbi:starch synthase [Candidatus Hakubella thermalkaliphila]|uniref:Starch synthase n=1 Tax=Candidatus Hakubella thermalkaliphila TaxID=2754717 RepID=A0A6V8NNP1_9ACTN|nr:glycosyltransferase [Candidatus Hakubella thermalkaliphila]GFP21733.1 starch synthase [Candidatus Hakubella thermalkaliphila]
MKTYFLSYFLSNMKAFIKFDAALAQRIYAGCDMFLMPSRFEPCGLGQLISMAYGTIPIVRRTGGLADTVKDFDPRTGTGIGFVFQNYNAMHLLVAIVRALEHFRNEGTWRSLMERAMSCDFSWDSSAHKYEEIYKLAIELRKKGH